MAQSIPTDTEFATAEEFAAQLATLLSENMPGGIFIEVGDDPSEVFVISRGANTTGVFSILVRTAELRVCGDG